MRLKIYIFVAVNEANFSLPWSQLHIHAQLGKWNKQRIWGKMIKLEKERLTK